LNWFLIVINYTIVSSLWFDSFLFPTCQRTLSSWKFKVQSSKNSLFKLSCYVDNKGIEPSLFRHQPYLFSLKFPVQYSKCFHCFEL